MKNVAIYVDYDNLFKRMKEFDLHPIHDVDFFVELKKKFQKAGYSVIKYNAFADFSDKHLSLKEQSDVHSYGVEVFHCSTSNKNTTDSELIIKVMKDLYTNDLIDVFVIVTNDRDFVPLIRAIKEKDKTTYSLTTKTKVNPIINIFSDYHQYLEDLFELEGLHNIDVVEVAKEEISEVMESKAKLMSEKFYTSAAFKNIKTKPVSLSVYSRDLAKIKSLKETKENIIEYFKIANTLEFVELYEKSGAIYIKEGKKYKELMQLEVAVAKKM
jgi:uncharacterized LabA/DUF88 family protein